MLIVVTLALITLAVVAVSLIVASGGDGDPNGEVILNTAEAVRTDLVVTESLSGTLGYGAAESVTFHSSADGVGTIDGLQSGTVTWVAPVGTVLQPGDVMYTVDTEPVVVLSGDLPAYRAFDSRMSDGPDVAQLEQALVDLGYDPDGNIVIDEDFTSTTEAAVERLQDALGAEDDGVLELGEVIFTPGPVYVAQALVEVGSMVGDSTPIVATSSAIEGTVTAVTAEGSVVGLGEQVLRIDDEPVVLLIGDVPVYRAMSLGLSGADVAQLEDALAALGYGEGSGFTSDGSFDESTRAAVVDWQNAIGAAPDGVVNVGDVIVSPTSVRVVENLVAVGDIVGDGTVIISTSESSTKVTVELSTDDQSLVSVGDSLTVVLPDGTAEPASVTEIGSVVQATQNGDTFFEMTVTLDDTSAAAGLDEAPVDVEIVTSSAESVIAVPVTALLALAEGGYAVEVANDDGTTELRAANPGLFADGLVEVTGNGLQAGERVVIP